MEHRAIAQKIANTVSRARRVLLVCHPSPDADTLGAACAFKQYLMAHGIEARIFCKTPAPKELKFLPQTEKLEHSSAVFTDPALDVVITFDAGDLRYLGIQEIWQELKRRPTLINIDHHTTNELFGDYNLVDTTASSTTEVLRRFFNAIDEGVDEDMATCLLAGLISDTDHFSNAATTASAMSVASEMIARGARLQTIRKNMLQNKTVSLLKLWGIALARLYYVPQHHAVVTYLFRKDYEDFNLSADEVNGIPNFLNGLDEGNYSLFLKETQEGTVKGSFRTTHDGIDVSAMAKRFGGGGHQKAAGFTVPGTLKETPRGVQVVGH